MRRGEEERMREWENEKKSDGEWGKGEREEGSSRQAWLPKEVNGK